MHRIESGALPGADPSCRLHGINVAFAGRVDFESLRRAKRVADGHRGHGKVCFSRDLSRASVDVKIEGVVLKTINMFHIHCGKPGVLGPILVDFSHNTNFQAELADGVFSVELSNDGGGRVCRLMAYRADSPPQSRGAGPPMYDRE